MIRVLVEARRGRARTGLEALIRSRRGFGLLEAPLAGSLVDHVVELAPDVVLLDAPEGDRASALRGIERLPRPPAIVLLVAGAPRAPSAAALRAGVRAELPPDASGNEILAAVEAAAAGLVAWRPESVGGRHHPGATDARSRAAPGGSRDLDQQPLTARETEILAMIAEGLGNKLIAARLGISRHTVKFHVASIFGKLGAGSRTEAVTTGLRRGLILI